MCCSWFTCNVFLASAMFFGCFRASTVSSFYTGHGCSSFPATPGGLAPGRAPGWGRGAWMEIPPLVALGQLGEVYSLNLSSWT